MGLFDRFKKKKMTTHKEMADALAKVEKLLNMDIKDIWDLEEDCPSFVMAMNGWICRKCSYGENISALTDEERVFFIVMGLDAEVKNGGFDQYLFNSTGDFANELLSSLYTVGADKTAIIFQRALDALGCKLPSNREQRIDLLEELRTDEISAIFDGCDNEFYEEPDDIETLCYQFILKNKSRFIM